MEDGFDIISVVNAKGGAGKTSVAKILISAALAAGRDVIFFDADPNKGLLSWQNKAVKAGNWPANAKGVDAVSVENVFTMIKKLNQQNFKGIVFIDTAGVGSTAHLPLVEESDFVVFPVMLGTDSIETTFETFRAVQEAVDKSAKSKAVLKVVRNSIPTKSAMTKAQREVFDEIGEHPACLESHINRHSIVELWFDEGPLLTRYQREKEQMGIAKVLAGNTHRVLDQGLKIINEIYEGA